METEAKVPEEESATIFTLIESTTTAEGEQIKFPQNNGNDLNPKYPLVEETSQANIGKTGEISVTGPQELYQNSNKVSAETKKHPEGHSTEVLKDSNAELMEMETISKSSVMEDEALSTLPNIASIQVERVDESIVDEIQNEAKSAMTDMREQQESERDFAEKEEVPEGFDLHEVRKSCTENVKKDESQLEAQSLETKVIKNPSLEEETTELNSSNDTEEHENVWESHLGATINATDGEKFINEEAKEMEEITNMQLLKTASKSVLENEATILSTSKFAKGETADEIFETKALKEEESAAKENESCVESKLEQATKAVEILPMFKQAIYLPVAVGDFGGHNEEQTDHLSEAQTFQSATTKHLIPEGFMTTERSTKSSYNIEEPGEIPDSHTAENSEIKDCGNSLLEPMDVELQKHETKSALEDKAQSDILTTVSHTEEKLEESTREEIHKEVESTVEDTKDKLTSEKNFEKKKKEDFDLHEVTREHEKKEESQPEAQSMETIIIKYQNLGVSTEINPSNDKEILEMTPRSLTEEKAKEIKEATDMQLTESATESVSDNEAQSAVAKSTTLIGEKVDEILQEQTLKEEESAAIDNSDSCTPENQLTQTDKFVEKIGLLETISKVAAFDEEHDNNHSVSPAFESVIKNDTLSEGLVTMESQSSTKFSCDVEELKKNPESHFVEISEHMDIENAAVEKAIYIKEATNFELPNSDRESHKSLSPLPSTEVAGVAMAEKICEEIHMKVESAVTGTKEEQRSENDFEKKKEAPKAINQSAAVGNIFVETKPEWLNQETTAINHQNLVETTKTKTSNSTQEFEIIAPSYTGVKTETEDGGKFIEEQEKDMEEATITQLMKTATESVQGGGAPSILLSSAIIRGETAQEIFPDGCKAENEHEKMAIKDELNQAVNLPIYMAKVNEENEEHCDHQSDVTTWESVITKHTISEGLEEKEISTNSSYDEEQEKILEQTTESLDIANRDKIPPEEAINVKEATEVDLRNSEMESVLEDEALTTLPFTASVEVETVGEPIQEEIHKEGESTVIDAKDTIEGALELQETTTENKKKDDPQLEVSSLQIIDTKLPNLVGETTETKPCNDSETNEEVSALPTRDKQEIKEGGSHTQDEAKVMEEATNMQLLETATESFDDEGPSIFPTLSIVKGQTVKETFLLQTLKDERPEATDTTECCTPENNLEQTEKIVEDIDTHETMAKVGAKNEEHADDESQPSELENVITNNTNSEGMMTTEDSTKASNDVEEQENISVSHSVENSEIKDSSKTLPEQTISMKEAAVDSSKFETESLHDNKALSTLHTVESIGVETVVECIQDQEETHTEGESTVTNTKEGQKPEDDFEEKKEVPEDFELHEPKDNISQSEALSLQTIAIKHLDLGDATETNSFNDYEDELTVPHNSEKLEIMDGGQFILEGEKEKEEAIETQLEESTKEMTGDDEAPSKFPTVAMAKGEVVDEVLQKQTFAEEEPTAIDKDESSVVENEHEVSAKLVEEIDLTETKGKDVAENKEQDDHQSKLHSLATQTTKHSNSEGTVIMECNTASYEVEEEKIPGSHSLDNLEIMDGVKTVPEQAIYNKEATYAELPKSETESRPEDQAMSTLSTTGSVGIETVEESIQEEVHREEESEVRETKVGQRPESDFEEEKKFSEDSDLHKTDNTSVETKTTYEMQSLETIAIEHSNSEAYTREITTSNDTQECEQVLASHTSEKLEIKDKGELILEEGKGKDKGIEIQLEEYAKEMTGVPDDEASSTLPTSAMFKDEKTNETIQELSFKKDDSAVVDTNRSFRQENEHGETSKVVEEHDTPKTIGKVGEDKDQYADYQSEFPILETLITQHTNSDEIVTVEGSTKTRYDLDEQEKIPESLSVKKSDVTDGGKALPEESTYVELLKSQTESGPEDKGLSTFPSTAALSVETVEENTQEGMHKEAESSGTDTEERQRPQNDFDEKKKVPEAFDMHEETINNCVETKKEPQFEAQSLETTAADHPALHTEELVINDTEKFILEESKEMEVSTGMQLQESTKESVTDDEAPSTLPTLALVKAGVIKEIISEETFKEEESAIIDYDWSYMPENELEQTTTNVEASDLPKIMGKLGAQNEEHTTKHTILEGLETKEISTESNYEGEKMENILDPVDSSQLKGDEKNAPEEATCIKKTSYAELKSERESVPEDQILTTFLTTASVEIKTSKESIQAEIHKQMKSAVSETKEGQKPEIESDKRTNFSEASHLLEVTLENKKIDELHFEEHSQETIVIEDSNLEEDNSEIKPYNDHFEEHSQETIVIEDSNLDEEITEAKPYNDTEEPEHIQASNTEENLVTKDEEKIIHEEAKVVEETNVMQLPESAEGSIPDDIASSTLPTSAIVKGEKVEDIIQEQTLKEEKSAAIDNDGSCRAENEVEQTTKVIETIDLPEIMGTVGDGNKEPTDYQSEVCTLETAIKEHIISEGLETTEIITESSYYVELLENIPESHNVDNSMILDGQKIMAEEAICIKEATNLETQNKESIGGPEDNALSTLSTIATVRVKTTEESIQDEMHKDAKPAVTLTTTEEKQRSKNDIDDRKEVQKVDLQEETRVNERMHEHQSEVQFLGTKTVLEHQVSGGDATKAVKIYDTKELEQVPTSHTEKKFENKDGAKFIDEKAIDVEEAINVQLPGSRESVLDNEVPSTLSTSSIVKGETAEEFFQDQTPKIEKSASIDNDGSSKPENEFEQTEKVVQEIDPTETTGKVLAENKEHPDHHSRALSSDTAISKHTIEEGLEAIETSKESSTTFVRVESIEQSIQENICTEEESALADTEEMWRPENDFKEKKTVVEDIDPYEAAAEYVKKDEPQYEAQSNAAMVIRYPNTGGTQETRLSSEIEELQHVPVLDDTQNIKIKEGGKYTQEEAQKIEEASSMQLTHSVKESVADDESLSTLAKYKIVKSETVDESVQEQTFNKETQAVSDNQWSCRPENVLEQTVKIVEEFNVPETKIKVGEENDKDGSHQSEVPALETLITKHAISVELETMEIHTKSSYNVQELENIPESHYVENSKIKDGGKTVPIEVIDINEATDAESEKSKTESMPEGKVLVETIEESIQKEMHEAELTVTDINESQKREYDFEEKTIPKAFDVCKATAENKKKDEPQFEVKSMGTIAIKHATLEGDTAETKPISDTEEQEQGPVSYTAEKSEIQDVGESILEKEKEMDETNDIQLEESSKESKPRDEAPSMFPTSAILKTEMPEEVFHEQTIEEEESATTDNGNRRPENELEQTAKVVEAIDLPKTMGKVSVENEEQAKNHSESPINSAGLAQMARSTESSYEVDAPDKIPEYSEGLFKITSSIERSYEVEALEKIPESSEGLVKMTSSNESSYEVHALEKISESQSVNNSEIKGCREIPKEETTNAQLSKCETESVPEDKSWSTLPTTASAGAETFEESTQENIHMEDKSALTHTREWQKPDNGLKENKNVPETFDQHKGTSNSSEENKKKDETQSDVQTANTTVTKFDEEMTDKNPNSYIEELVMVQESHSRAEIEIKDGGKFMPEEEKEMEEATCTQLPISSKPSVPNEEALPTMSTLAIVKGEREIVEEIFQEQTLKEEESAATDSNGSSTPKNKLEQMKRVVEEVDLPGTKCKLNAENEKHTDHQSEAPTLRNVIKTHTNSDGMLTLDSSTKSSYDVKQEEKSLEAHTFDNSKNKNAGKTSPEEAIYIKEATNVELAKLETESMLEDKSLPTLLTTEAVRTQMVDEQINIQKVTESAVIDTTEEHGPEKDFEENKISQAFNVNGVTRNTCAESKEKNEAQSEVQSQETIVIKHPSMEGTIIETDPNYYTKKHENVPSSSTREILGGKFIQDKEKEHKETTGMQLLKTSPAGVPEALSTLPKSAIVKGETIDEIFEDHTLKEEESAVIDDRKICRPENQIEQTPEVVEAIDLIETMSKVNAQNKEHADFQSEALTSDNVVSKNTISDGMLTTESCIKSSYDVKKLEKLPQSHTAGISEIKDVVKSPHEEAIYVKEETNVELHKPEAESMPYEALSTTITISDRVKTVEEGIIHEIHKESKSAVTDDKDGKRQENNFEEKEKIPEAFNLHEETDNAFLEHEKNAEIQCEEHCVETMLISPNNNTAEREKFSALHTGVILEMEEARDVQLPTSKTESAKLDAYEKSDMRESTTMDKSELPEENISFYSLTIGEQIPEPTYPDHEVCDLIKEQLPQTKEKGYNIQDQISESDDHIQGQTPLCEDQLKPEPQMEAEHHLNVPLSAKETSVVGLITIGVQDAVDRAGTIENIQDEKAIDSGNSLEKVQISSTTEETVNQVKDEFNKKFEAKDPDDDDDDEQKAKTNLSIENDPIEKEAAADRDTAEVIESPKEDEGGKEFVNISSSSSGGAVMIEASRDTDVKATPHKKSHGILSGVGSKVKHSISKVKKAITGKSSHPKTQSPK